MTPATAAAPAPGSSTSPAAKHSRAASQQKLEQLSINTIRTLAMDAVQAANSGHPGTAMAMAPVVYSLWNRDPMQVTRNYLVSRGKQDPPAKPNLSSF